MSDTLNNNGKILRFPSTGTRVTRSQPRGLRRSCSLRGFRVCTGEPRKVTSLTRERIDAAFGLSWSAALVIEIDDPKFTGKRDIHLRYLEHNGVRWKVQWMDRTRSPGKKHYGLTRG